MNNSISPPKNKYNPKIKKRFVQGQFLVNSLACCDKDDQWDPIRIMTKKLPNLFQIVPKIEPNFNGICLDQYGGFNFRLHEATTQHNLSPIL